MRLVIQRVTHAAVTVGAERVSAIGPGLLVLVGVECGDTPDDVAWLAKKTAGLRIFNDADGVMNRSVTEAGGQVLAVSQFTLTASTRKGNRPSYIRAAARPTRGPRTLRRRHGRGAVQRRPRHHHHRLAPPRIISVQLV